MTTKNPALHMASFCVKKLAERDIQATIVCNESTDGEVVLQVPALELNEELSQCAVYRLVSELLEDHDGDGLQLTNPITGDQGGVFCYHPDTFMPSGDGADVEYWPGEAGASFSWADLMKDSTAWCEGWPIPFSEMVGQRVGFLASLFMAKPVSLPRYRAS
ncbi:MULTISPECIES: hypothetical protein [Pseudomonas]|uniref:hypothetical protein n=1 Tax=Pseudomonas TaxID=286 RepID=UPI000C33B73A|nr:MULTISPECIES: hypothetical protein [Pseudomonas]PWC98741.1 hypothetical protein CX658_32110 [Pseudomonas amygdali pv. lachrymans]PWC98791.1 hypothetical protein CX658_31755 [Pseudomonas amygdali pv. lachrymans]WNZ87296.1 hypothetical protein QOM10_30565 [Pseudomonas sp. P108]